MPDGDREGERGAERHRRGVAPDDVGPREEGAARARTTGIGMGRESAGDDIATRPRASGCLVHLRERNLLGSIHTRRSSETSRKDGNAATSARVRAGGHFSTRRGAQHRAGPRGETREAIVMPGMPAGVTRLAGAATPAGISARRAKCSMPRVVSSCRVGETHTRGRGRATAGLGSRAACGAARGALLGHARHASPVARSRRAVRVAAAEDPADDGTRTDVDGDVVSSAPDAPPPPARRSTWARSSDGSSRSRRRSGRTRSPARTRAGCSRAWSA